MRAAVLGSPIKHSLSPILHRAAYSALGLDTWTYEAFECDEAGLAPFLKGLDRDWAGLSLTMPLKREALKLADEVSELAVAVGGANTLVFRDGRSRADNTDVHGIVAALTEVGLGEPGSAVILGAGATAASSLAALRLLGLRRVTLAVREPSRATETVRTGTDLGVDVSVCSLAELASALPADLVISTLPGEAAGPYASVVAESGSAVFDVVYAPWPTLLAAEVERAGGTAFGGFPMLLHQAVRQVELFTGSTGVPVEAMRAAGQVELARRAKI